MYIFGSLLFALVALLFVVILLGPDRYSKDGYVGMTIWAAAMSGISFFWLAMKGSARRRRNREDRGRSLVMGGLVRDRLGIATGQKARRGGHACGEALSGDGVATHPLRAACA